MSTVYQRPVRARKLGYPAPVEEPVRPLSDEDLEGMLAVLESDRAERKESLGGDAPTKVREAICAFANDLPGHAGPGVVFINARDDGTPARTSITEELLNQLADMKSDGQIVPPPTLTVHKRALRGAEMAVVTVWPSDSPPVRYKGRIWIRNGSRRQIASAQDERILNERRRHGDKPFDIRPVDSARLADLDLLRFEQEYLVAAVAPDVLAANERTTEQRLAATKMIATSEVPVPTVLGLIVVSPRTRDFLPGAYVQFLRVAGRDLSAPVVDAQDIDGTLVDVIRRTEEKLASHNRTAIDFTSRSTERRVQTYPLPALQQLLRNAVMHRSYEATNAPVRVTWYDDRIEIVNPGGPFGLVTSENFGRPGITDYRNPNLAEAMRALGFVQRFGAGIATARRALQDNGNPTPRFEVTPSHVLVTIEAAS
jgi:ATP-dependent DNA helicase RecG